MKIHEIFETASAGSTASGSIASVANPIGGISRRPNLFGWVPPKKKKKSKKKSKKS